MYNKYHCNRYYIIKILVFYPLLSFFFFMFLLFLSIFLFDLFLHLSSFLFFIIFFHCYFFALFRKKARFNLKISNILNVWNPLLFRGTFIFIFFVIFFLCFHILSFFSSTINSFFPFLQKRLKRKSIPRQFILWRKIVPFSIDRINVDSSLYDKYIQPLLFDGSIHFPRFSIIFPANKDKDNNNKDTSRSKYNTERWE